MSRRAMAWRGGSFTRPLAISSRVNQRTSSSSPSPIAGSPDVQRAMKPSISEAGNGHGCDER